METTKAPLSGTASVIVGTVGGLLIAASPMIPAPWGALAGLVGFIAAGLAGASAAAPKLTDGKPMVQGTVLTVITSLLGLFHQFYPLIPAGWIQSVALGVAGIFAWLAGKSIAPLGTPSASKLAEVKKAGEEAAGNVVSLEDAAKELSK